MGQGRKRGHECIHVIVSLGALTSITLTRTPRDSLSKCQHLFAPATTTAAHYEFLGFTPWILREVDQKKRTPWNRGQDGTNCWLEVLFGSWSLAARGSGDHSAGGA